MNTRETGPAVGGRFAAPGDPGASRDDVILANMGLVRKVACGLQGRGLDFDDLVHEGVVGLMHAAELFDPSRGVKFSTYAVHSIRRTILRAVEDKADTIRVPSGTCRDVAEWRRAERDLYLETGRRPGDGEIADRLGLKSDARDRLAKALAARRAGRGDGALEMDRGARDEPADAWEAEERAELDRRLAALDERQRLVLTLRLGLGGGPEMTLAEVGERIGVTRERVRQIEVQALRGIGLRKPGRGEGRELYAAGKGGRA